MKLLAIDTSSPSTVLVVADGERVLAERRHDPVGKERPQHTTLGLPLAAEALAEACLTWQDLERIGVGSGPGSFTGLRAGLSAATALALRLDLPVVGLRATALLAAGDRSPGVERPVLAVIDGRRRELFVERFETADAVLAGGASQVLAVDAAADFAGARGALAIGDGAVLAADALRSAGAEVPEIDDPRHRISPAALALLTAHGTPVSAVDLRPAYGREPDAVPTAEREAKR